MHIMVLIAQVLHLEALLAPQVVQEEFELAIEHGPRLRQCVSDLLGLLHLFFHFALVGFESGGTLGSHLRAAPLR